MVKNEPRALDASTKAFLARVQYAYDTCGKNKLQVETDGGLASGSMTRFLVGDRGKNTGSRVMSQLAKGLEVNKAWLEDGVEPMRAPGWKPRAAIKLTDIKPADVEDAPAIKTPTAAPKKAPGKTVPSRRR